jgi:hypothetical protein
LLRARAASAGLAALIGLALASTGAFASDPSSVLYQWTDEQGNVRYTPDPDRVPSGQRATLQPVEPGMPATSAPGRPVTAPTEPAPPPLQPPPAASAPPAPVAVPSAVAAPSARPHPSLAPVEPGSAVVAPVAVPSATTAPVGVPGVATAPVDVPDAAAVRAPSAAAASVAVPNATPRSESRPAPSTAPQPAAADATREQQLSAAIAADQETLKTLLAAPPIPGETASVDSPQLREIARRLPELQAELRALRERQTPPAGP